VKKIFTPIKIGPLELKNRMVGAPSVTYNAAPTGEVTQRQIDMYIERAKGGFAMVTVEASTVRYDGCAFPCFLSIDHPKFLPGLSQIVEGVHLHGAKVAIQLIHTGRNAQREFIGTDPVAPSDLRIWRDKPRVMSTAECEEMIGLFAKSAGMAKSIGFDAINIHGALGHLPAQFLSPWVNNRTDKYGERTRWVVELIQAIRAAVGPNVAIIYRGAGEEYVPGGLTIEDWKQIAPVLIEAGVDCIDVYPGIFESTVEATLPLYLPEGSYLHHARAMKSVCQVPVMVVGKLMNPKLAERVIEEGWADLVTYSRPMFADPFFPKKMLDGRYDDIRKCCGCDRCVGDGFSGRMTECSINPEFQHEGTFAKARPPETKKKVLVAGGGVGGMEAARVASLRGHEVVLYEKGQELGGLVSAVSSMPRLYMKELNYFVEWLSGQLQKLGVQVNLGQEVTPDLVARLQPDVVFVATGSRANIPDIPGARGPNVIRLVEDYLMNGASVGNRVVVIGGMHGAEVAVSLAREGKDVTVLDPYPNNIATAPYLVLTVTRWIAMNTFIQRDGVKPRLGVTIREISAGGVRIADQEGKEEVVPADTVILALPRLPLNDLATTLKANFGANDLIKGATAGSYVGSPLRLNGKICQLYEIGDCVEPRTMKEAVHAAFAYALEI
jgi:2,4-dienoyl-CoA reductase-like NADH-dependent reductase (Old Yellow Enzyme family)/thioredoxin reductase